MRLDCQPVLRKSILVMLALVAALLVPLTANAQGPKVRIGYNINLGNSPAPVAAERGIFRKHGVDVEVKVFGSGPALTQAMATKQVDLAYVGFLPAYGWHEREVPTVAIAQSSYGLGSIVVRADSGITSLADLKGKSIAGSRKGSGNDAILRMLLLRELAKLEPDRDVQIVGMGEEGKGEALLEKKVDAAFLVEPFTTQVLATERAKLLVSTVDAAPKHPWYLIAARADWVKEHRELAVKIVRAHVEAVKLLAGGEGTDSIVKIFNLAPVTGASGKVTSPADIVRLAKERVGFDYELSEREMEFFERQVVWARALGFSKGAHKARDLFDPTILRDALNPR
jgi:NitT/TauT family transport system substrate-binding protein